MHFELVDIQPRDVKFIFEPRKQCSCTITLVNKTDKNVAFKVKTTNPKKYCVRPNTGVISSKSSCEFKITMQAQREPPPDMVCKDKFLVQSKVVSDETSENDITSETFSKDDGKYVQENKLRVLLVSPPNSPVLSPVNGAADNHPPNFESSTPKCLEDLLDNETEIPQQKPNALNFESSAPKASEDHDRETQIPQQKLDTPKFESSAPKSVEDLDSETQIPLQKPAEDNEFKQKNHEEPVEAKHLEISTKDFDKPAKDEEYRQENLEELVEPKHSEISMTDDEKVEFVNDNDTTKSKLNALELKLKEAEATILKLAEERRASAQERESLQRELVRLRDRKTVRKVQAGFPLLFVVMVALVSIALGYMIRSQ